MSKKIESLAMERIMLDPFVLWAEVLNLPPGEAVIIVLRFGLDGEQECTLEECAQIFEMSRERVRQIQQRALERLRARLGVVDDLRRCIEKAHPFGRSENDGTV